MLATITFTLSTALIASAARSLSLNVVTSSTEVIDIDNFHVNATLSNTGSETLRLLRDPRSPLSTWATETFGVINSKGARAEFSGIKVRYDPQAVTKAGRPDSFVELNPGESVTVKHDLAGVYNLTLTGTGTYTVDAANLFRVVEGNNTLTDIYADIITAKVKIQGKLVSFKNAAATPVVSLLSEYTEYSGCTANQQGEIASAIESARGYATSSYDHLRSNPYGSSRYTRWFGRFSYNRYSLVLDSFSRLRTYPGGWTYDCGTCTEPDAYAYVYPSRYGVVYLCSAFWSAPETGAASKADTIIHEGTHFPPVIGTSDYAYGQSNCLALARSNPTNAVYNADNHAFFSVDTEIR
ncbi:Lysine-specific metallo-endopeptidase [Rhizoctonia solani]|uniref:Lysine-specific metallo-endopeptidase n=1 Tax=Rhizoctonia solani TaxID=456999 RepID=A0A8H7HFM9_9AGAM|nr:Lysine-specific metallo-endopeptidase [Rhizoctonia solani]